MKMAASNLGVSGLGDMIASWFTARCRCGVRAGSAASFSNLCKREHVL